ncbi:MAG: ABC transporter ATP-binding protein/permease [Alphaproteobacteria bacterium]|nr:ABC transporter ATP-binding protein/permease [Alphaproteobacteria bacterium]
MFKNLIRLFSAYTSIFKIFFAAGFLQPITVLICLVLAGLFESIGLMSLLPSIVIASGQTSSDPSSIEKMTTQIFMWLGIPLEIEILLGIFVLGIVLKSILTMITLNYVGYTVASVATNLRLSLIDCLLNAKWSYYSRQPIGRFANAIGGEAGRASEAYSSAASVMNMLIQTIIYALLALAVSWKLALTSLLIGGIISLSLVKLTQLTREAGRKQTKKTRSLVTKLTDFLVGIKAIKAMAKHIRLGQLFSADTYSLNKSLRHQVLYKYATKNIQEPLTALFLALFFYGAAKLWQIPLTELIVMGIIMSKTINTFGKIQQSLQLASASESAYWSMQKVIKEAKSQIEINSGKYLPKLEESLKFNNVSFSYGPKKVLHEISLMIPAGKITAITGVSGAGKTTIADLLLGFHLPESGQVLIDDTPLDLINLHAWRSMIGYVPQEVILFHDSIINNITLGESKFTRHEVEEAIKAAGVWDYVYNSPEGLDTIVGERGTLMSGGQRQRIAIARALVHKPKLLILDEATSALDPETEASICKNIRALSGDFTILAITHQPAWVQTSDVVYHVAQQQVTEIKRK